MTIARSMQTFAIVLALAGCVAGQAARHDDVVLATGNVGKPANVLPGAQVRVCQDGATYGTGVPCSPAANIYTDRTMGALAPNPFFADADGNFHFYAPVGFYVVETSFAGVTKDQPDYFVGHGNSGTNGSTWYSGAGVPSAGLGANGDFYIDTASGKYYQKSLGAWSLLGNLTGPTGPQGSALTPSTIQFDATTLSETPILIMPAGGLPASVVINATGTLSCSVYPLIDIEQLHAGDTLESPITSFFSIGTGTSWTNTFTLPPLWANDTISVKLDQAATCTSGLPLKATLNWFNANAPIAGNAVTVSPFPLNSTTPIATMGVNAMVSSAGVYAYGTLSCSTYPHFEVHVTRGVSDLLLASFTTNNGQEWVVSGGDLGFSALQTGDLVFAKVSLAGVGCAGRVTVGVNWIG